MCRSLEEFSDIEKILIISQKHNNFFLNKGSKSFHTVWTYGHDPVFLKAVQQKKRWNKLWNYYVIKLLQSKQVGNIFVISSINPDEISGIWIRHRKIKYFQLSERSTLWLKNAFNIIIHLGWYNAFLIMKLGLHLFVGHVYIFSRYFF